MASSATFSIAFTNHVMALGDPNVTLTIAMTGTANDADLEVPFHTAVQAAADAAPGVAYNGNGVLSFGPGAISPFAFTLSLKGDNLLEGPEVLAISISNPSAGTVTGATASVTVQDTSKPATIPAPTNVGLPTISGTPAYGQTLTMTTGSWTGSPSFTYAWLRNGIGTAVGTNLTYVLQEADAGAVMVARVTATNAGGTTTADSVPTTAIAIDRTPTAFSFAAQTGIVRNTTVESNAITVGGLDASAPVIVTNGEWQKNNGAWLNTSGSVVNGDTVKVRHTASSSFSTGVTTTLQIGTGSATFTSTSEAQDTTPNSFVFTPVTQATTSTDYISNTITVAGINDPATVTVSGGSYSKNGAAYTTGSGTAVASDQFNLKLTSSASNSTLATATLTIGGVAGAFQVTTAASSGTALAGTPDATGAVTTVNWSNQVPTLADVGYQGSLTAASTITTTNSGSNTYRSGNIIFLKGTLDGYDISGYQIQPQTAGWIVRNCYSDLSIHNRVIYIPTGFTAPSGGTITRNTFDGTNAAEGPSREIYFCDPRIHHAEVSYNKMIKVPWDGFTFGGSCGVFIKNVFKGCGMTTGAHPDCITFNAGYTSQLESVIMYNDFDGWDPAIKASNASVSIKDGTEARSNYWMTRNFHKGHSIQHQIDFNASSKVEIFQNVRWLINGPPVYGNNSTTEQGIDGPYGAFYGEAYTTTSDFMLHDEIEGRDGSVAYELAGGNPPQNQQKSSQKLEKIAPGRPGQITITSINAAGAYVITAASGTPTSYQYRTEISGTGRPGAWTNLANATSGTLTLIANAWNQVWIRAVNANGPGPSSLPYQVASGTVTASSPTFTANPVVSGTTTQGQTLSTTTGTIAGSPTPTAAIQWQRDSAGNGTFVDIAGATASTYALTGSDVGNKVRSKVVATNSQGSATAFSAPTGIIAATGGSTITLRSVGTEGVSALGNNVGNLTAQGGMPAGWQPGDLLLMRVSHPGVCDDPGTARADFTTITGTTWTRCDTGGNPAAYTFYGQCGVALYKRTAVAGDTAPTVSVLDDRAGDYLTVQIAAFTGGNGIVEAVFAEYTGTTGTLTSAGGGRTSVMVMAQEALSIGGTQATSTPATGYSAIAASSISDVNSYRPSYAIDTKTGITAGSVPAGHRTFTPSDPGRAVFCHALIS